MKVVTDTSPICYLLLTDLIELLPSMFGKVLVPQAVARELAHSAADRKIRDWIAKPPSWLEIREAPTIEGELAGLGLGEREVIALAESVAADLLILDEKRARRVAQERGLTITGLLGALSRAAEKGLVELPEALARLRRTSFRADPKLFASLLEM